MFYEIEATSHVRVSPENFNKNTKKAVFDRLIEQFSKYISKDLGIVIGISDVLSIGDGVLIPGDGAAYYKAIYKIIVYRPELQEVVLGNIKEVADFGAFIDMGPVDGMIHISQTMDDFVTYNKAGSLTGKESKKVLKAGDKCRARIVAISYKEIQTPKIGLTMRQPWLGQDAWLEEDLKKQKEVGKKESKWNYLEK